jgi:hypothetical protein
MKWEQKSVTVYVSVPVEAHSLIKEHAEKIGLSVSDTIRMILSQYSEILKSGKNPKLIPPKPTVVVEISANDSGSPAVIRSMRELRRNEANG